MHPIPANFPSPLLPHEQPGLSANTLGLPPQLSDVCVPLVAPCSKRGAVINISSASGSFPCSLLSVYSSTKAYMDNMSICLDDEYGRKGIFVQSLMPLYVASKLSKMRPSFFTATPSQYARSAVATIGYDKRTFGYIPHKMQMWVLNNFPWVLIQKALWSMHMSVRARALKKKAAATKQN